ncbi:MAG: TlpA family protein disulfide reductase [Chitinophagaceae bacterium]|nr:TlpA family protein disulfide reductase [Chitinophagaceae bacterium]
MKKILLLSLLVSCSATSGAQPDAASTVKNIQTLLPFRLTLLPDSTEFSSEQLQKNKPVVLMFFNPDCEHCQRQTKELLAYKRELKDIQIVMASSLPFQLIKEFYDDYKIASMPNVIMGLDENYILRVKYRPTNFPSLFIYDSNHQLAKVFAGNIGVPTIIDALK